MKEKKWFDLNYHGNNIPSRNVNTCRRYTCNVNCFSDKSTGYAQQMSGDITARAGENPFGGEKMGTIIVDSSGRRTNVSVDINAMPNEGNVLEGWLVDEGSGYKLSLGQFRNGTLDSSQYMVNPYTYNNFEVSEEPAEDPDPNAADSVAGFEL